jgi:hypothetical protein
VKAFSLGDNVKAVSIPFHLGGTIEVFNPTSEGNFGFLKILDVVEIASDEAERKNLFHNMDKIAD